MLQKASHIWRILLFWLLWLSDTFNVYNVYAEVDWTLVSLGTQVQPQVIFDSDYLPDYISISYDYTGIDKLYWYCNNSYEAKYHLSISKRKSVGCRFKAV